ncbi:MAG: tRNA 5-hydroxyuridine modification protein YegQ [Arsenophonus sp.]|nr:MAG: tRNA 5-hydroxyuridine modification protein YegQ [Arsenophonus sp.]
MVELLSPAGSLKHMRYAFAYGADAVYAGQPRYSLRVRNNDFDYEKLNQGIQESHNQGKRFYVVLNIIPHNSKIKTFIQDISPIVKMNPDAFIVSDPGLIMMLKDSFSNINIHLSVQSNAINWATVKFWKKIGLSRIILSRELDIEEIYEIHKKVPDIELEVFIHGALCMAYSGRCLLSSYLSKRDANQGACTNICRWKYDINQNEKIKEKKQTYKSVIINRNNSNLEKMQVIEDIHGTYILNSKDLCGIKYIKELLNSGVCSFKIEGRTKSFYYCARTAQIYRNAIDDAISGRPFNNDLLKMLSGLSNRGYTSGFFKRHDDDDMNRQNYIFGHSVSYTQKFVGEFTGQYKDHFAEVNVKNKFSIGDNLELITPIENFKFILDAMLDKNKSSIIHAKGNGYIVYLKIPKKINLKFALLIKNLI